MLSPDQLRVYALASSFSLEIGFACGQLSRGDLIKYEISDGSAKTFICSNTAGEVFLQRHQK